MGHCPVVYKNLPSAKLEDIWNISVGVEKMDDCPDTVINKSFWKSSFPVLSTKLKVDLIDLSVAGSLKIIFGDKSLCDFDIPLRRGIKNWVAPLLQNFHSSLFIYKKKFLSSEHL